MTVKRNLLCNQHDPWPIEGTRSPKDRDPQSTALYLRGQLMGLKSNYAAFYQAHFQGYPLCFADRRILSLSLYCLTGVSGIRNFDTDCQSSLYKHTFPHCLEHCGRYADIKSLLALHNFYDLSNFTLIWGPSISPETYVIKTMKCIGWKYISLSKVCMTLVVN